MAEYEVVGCAEGEFHEVAGKIQVRGVVYDYKCKYETNSARPNQVRPIGFMISQDGKRVKPTEELVVEIIADVICSSDKGGEDL